MLSSSCPRTSSVLHQQRAKVLYEVGKKTEDLSYWVSSYKGSGHQAQWWYWAACRAQSGAPFRRASDKEFGRRWLARLGHLATLLGVLFLVFALLLPRVASGG